jgi:sulfite reductase (ferredoxin)
VSTCPAEATDRRQEIILSTANRIAKHFRPRTRAYYEVWLDGAQAVTAEAAIPDPEEPFYGDTYLPRKFKFGIAWPGDNCVDIYTHDCGLIPLNADGSVPTGGVTEGYVVLAGGGLGMGYADVGTFPRLSDTVCWVPTEQLIEVLEAIVVVHRDHGDRSNRKRARLKYVIADNGLEWFQARVAEQIGRPLSPAPPIPAWEDACDHLGWSPQPDGRWTLGLPVPSGRVADGATHAKDATSTARRRSAIRAVITKHGANVRLTARQDILLTGLDPADRLAIEVLLREHDVRLVEELGIVERAAMACPALPTCGQALTESERVLPSVVASINAARSAAGTNELPIHLRMTGCPNGCARPYTAELGIVGRTKSTYDLYLGGSVAGERLAERLAVGVKLGALEGHLTTILEGYAADAMPGEAFGDFCVRVGVEKLTAELGLVNVESRAVAADADGLDE